MKQPKTIVLMLLCLILAFLAIFAGVKNQKLLKEIDILKANKPIPAGHACSYVNCPFKGQETFKNDICGCEPGGDCSALDRIHFEHPAWSYDQCEEYLFAPMREEPKSDYQINILFDTLWLYDGSRLVGRIDYTKNKIDSIIMADNE